MEGESGVLRRIIDELHAWNIQGDQMEGESGVTRSIVHELHSSDIQRYERTVKVVLLELSLMNFILLMSDEIKWKVKVVLIEVLLMNLVVRI